MARLKNIQSVILAVVALYLGVGTFGMRMGMDMSAAPSCVMMGHGDRMCPMTVANHLSAWESMFAGLPAKAFLHFVVIIKHFINEIKCLINALWLTKKIYGRGRGDPGGSPNIVIRLISRGIVQPTVYG